MEVPIEFDIKIEEYDDASADLIDEKLLKELQADTNTTQDQDQDQEKYIKHIFFCNYCPHKYNKLEYLQIHEYVHDPNKFCPLCNSKFSAKDFQKHLNGHIKEKIEEERRLSRFCEHCNKTFTSAKCARIHKRIHTGERPYVCQICGKGFKQRGQLKDHNRTHSDVKDFSCTVCKGTFSTSSSLKRHMKNIHEAGKIYTCNVCSEKFSTLSILINHKRSQHPEKTRHNRKCPYCPLQFKSFYLYVRHRNIHLNENDPSKTRYRCMLCGKRCLTYPTLMQHQYSHLQYTKEDFQTAKLKRLYSCKLCDRGFSIKHNLLKHMSFHMEKTQRCDVCYEFFSFYGYTVHRRFSHIPLHCKTCRKSFPNKTRLKCHVDTVHPCPEKNYVCDVCGKSYAYKHILGSHKALAHVRPEDRKYLRCSFCGRTFISKMSLGMHLTRMHPNSARFKCDSCNLLFYIRTDFNDHNNACHSGKAKEQKSYLCKICKQELPSVYQLKFHKKSEHHIPKVPTKFQCHICLKYFQNKRGRNIHLQSEVCSKYFGKIEKKAYICKVCSKEFIFRSALISHMVVHSKSYGKCRFCGKKFTKSYPIKGHMANRHPGEKGYYCGFCDKSFDTLSQLKSHRYAYDHIRKVEVEAALEEENYTVVIKETVNVTVKEEPKE